MLPLSFPPSPTERELFTECQRHAVLKVLAVSTITLTDPVTTVQKDTKTASYFSSEEELSIPFRGEGEFTSGEPTTTRGCLGVRDAIQSSLSEAEKFPASGDKTLRKWERGVLVRSQLRGHKLAPSSRLTQPIKQSGTTFSPYQVLQLKKNTEDGATTPYFLSGL